MKLKIIIIIVNHLKKMLLFLNNLKMKFAASNVANQSQNYLYKAKRHRFFRCDQFGHRSHEYMNSHNKTSEVYQASVCIAYYYNLILIDVKLCSLHIKSLKDSGS